MSPILHIKGSGMDTSNGTPLDLPNGLLCRLFVSLELRSRDVVRFVCNEIAISVRYW